MVVGRRRTVQSARARERHRRAFLWPGPARRSQRFLRHGSSLKFPFRIIAETCVLFRASLPYDAAEASGRTHCWRFPPSGVDMSIRSIRIGYILLAILVCCAALARVELRASPRVAEAPGYWGFDRANLDKTCKPCDDFFQFAMGG